MYYTYTYIYIFVYIYMYIYIYIYICTHSGGLRWGPLRPGRVGGPQRPEERPPPTHPPSTTLRVK